MVAVTMTEPLVWPAIKVVFACPFESVIELEELSVPSVVVLSAQVTVAPGTRYRDVVLYA
jgi:hypothetical protein